MASHRNIWFWRYLTAGSPYRRGHSTGVTSNVVVSFPGCSTHLGPASLSRFAVRRLHVSGPRRYYLVCMPLDQGMVVFSLAWYFMWDILHALSSLRCWLLLSSACRSTILLKRHLFENLFPLKITVQSLQFSFPLTYDAKLSLAIPLRRHGFRKWWHTMYFHFYFSVVRFPSLPNIFMLASDLMSYTFHRHSVDDPSWPLPAIPYPLKCWLVYSNFYRFNFLLSCISDFFSFIFINSSSIFFYLVWSAP